MVELEQRSLFRDSIAWQKAMELSVAIYAATRAFPKEEIFGLTNQMRRAAVSVPSNIAEGKGRLTTGEFLHFLGMARGSLLEVQTQIELSLRLGLGSRQELDDAQVLCGDVLRILNASLRTLQAKKRSEVRKQAL